MGRTRGTGTSRRRGRGCSRGAQDAMTDRSEQDMQQGLVQSSVNKETGLVSPNKTPTTPDNTCTMKCSPPSALDYRSFREFSLKEADMLSDLQELYVNDYAQMAAFLPNHTEDNVRTFCSILNMRKACSPLNSDNCTHGPRKVVPRHEMHIYEEKWYEHNVERLDAIRELRKLPQLAIFKAWSGKISPPGRPEKCTPPVSVSASRVCAVKRLQNHRHMAHFKAWQDGTPPKTDLFHQAKKREAPVPSVCTPDRKRCKYSQ